MTADLLLLWVCLGAALFVADLLLLTRPSEFVDLWRYALRCHTARGPAALVTAYAAVALVIASAIVLGGYCLLWPFRVRKFFAAALAVRRGGDR